MVTVTPTVKVDCTPTDMLVTFSFGTPFEGRVYATGNAQACFEMGNRQTQVILRVPLGSTCGTVEEVSVTWLQLPGCGKQDLSSCCPIKLILELMDFHCSYQYLLLLHTHGEY